MVRRMLESFTRHCETHGRRPRFLVIDGSQRPENRRATRSVVTALAGSTRLDLSYVGRAEAAAFSRALRKNGIPGPTFVPGAIGANRNLLLLMTAGEHMLQADDDIVCDAWALPGRHTDVAVTGHHELREVAFFKNRAASLAAITPTRTDLLAVHESLLGRSLPDLITASPRPADLTRACTHVFSGLLARRRQDVKATFSGLAGDSATYCPGRLLLRSDSVRDHLWSSQTAFRHAMTYREVFRIAKTLVVTHNCQCMAFCMGIANQSGVPPFMPVARNEDGVFGILTAVCDPASLFGHVPIGVIHDSDRPSKYAGPRTPSASESRLGDLVINLLLRDVSSLSQTSPSDRMREIGEILVHIGGLRRRAFIALATELTLETRHREIARAEKSAADADCPGYWSEALIRYHTEFLKAVLKPEFVLPREFHGLGSLDAAYDAVQACVRHYGRLIASWPVLWQAARELNADRA
jgi:hypothetical protein